MKEFAAVSLNMNYILYDYFCMIKTLKQGPDCSIAQFLVILALLWHTGRLGECMNLC